MTKKKSLCDFTKKDYDKHCEYFKSIMKKPKFICKKCFRACADKDHLCKPSKF